MKRFLISPPFGNWIQSSDCTSVVGSFTWQPRPGLIRNTLKTFRKVKGGWINKIGLRNKGIRSVEQFDYNKIYSLVGLEDGDWERMLDHCPVGITVEINLGCPNVHEYGIPMHVLKNYCTKFNIIAKLPPTAIVDDMAAMCIEAGAQFLHLSNTVPTDKGGISGAQLREVNLPIVERMTHRYPGMIIAGGGIYTKKHLDMYSWVGATHFSLSTVWLTPWRIRKLKNLNSRTYL